MDFVKRVVEFVQEDWLRTVAILVIVLVSLSILVGISVALVSIGGWGFFLTIVGVFLTVLAVAWAIDYLTDNY